MIQKNKNKGAFTLVELIVVITILAILGTIAFISLQGYSGQARNSKRQADLGNIAQKMEVMMISGVSLSSFVGDSSSTLSGSTTGLGTSAIRIAGREGGSALTGKYKAGDINYDVLGVKQEDFLDPTFNVPYKIGHTSYGGQYELAATLEDDGEYDSYVRGTWLSRKSSNITYTLTESSLNNGSVVYLSGITVRETGLRVGDIVRFENTETGKYAIINMKGDAITVDQPIIHGGVVIFLHGDETRSLIKRWDSDNAIDFGKGYKYTPYYQ